MQQQSRWCPHCKQWYFADRNFWLFHMYEKCIEKETKEEESKND